MLAGRHRPPASASTPRRAQEPTMPAALRSSSSCRWGVPSGSSGHLRASVSATRARQAPGRRRTAKSAAAWRARRRSQSRLIVAPRGQSHHPGNQFDSGKKWHLEQSRRIHGFLPAAQAAGEPFGGAPPAIGMGPGSVLVHALRIAIVSGRSYGNSSASTPRPPYTSILIAQPWLCTTGGAGAVGARARQLSAPGDPERARTMSKHDDDENEGDDRRTRSLAGLAAILLLAVIA